MIHHGKNDDEKGDDEDGNEDRGEAPRGEEDDRQGSNREAEGRDQERCQTRGQEGDDEPRQAGREKGRAEKSCETGRTFHGEEAGGEEERGQAKGGRQEDRVKREDEEEIARVRISLRLEPRPFRRGAAPALLICRPRSTRRARAGSRFREDWDWRAGWRR